VTPIEFCPIARRRAAPTIQSLPKPRPTLIGMPFIPKTQACQLRPVGLAFEDAPHASMAMTIDARALFTPEVASPRRRQDVFRPPTTRPRADTFVVEGEVVEPKALGKGESVLLGMTIGLALMAIGSLAAAHTPAITSLLSLLG
jgi:hypothetical protein